MPVAAASIPVPRRGDLLIKPLGEMPKWRVARQVIMTHGFMHLGEINALRGQLGLPFSI